MRKLLLLLAILVGFVNVQGQTFNGNEKDIQAILKNTRSFSEYVMDSNYEMIAKSYTDDAKIFPNNTPILEGEDIIAYWTLPEGVSTPYHKITQSEIAVVEDTAYDYGYYEGKTKRQDGSISSWNGKYVIVWKKENGEWKMYLDIWNSLGKK